ncbi:hypothetical protein ABHN11_13270 [Brevibacillus centrosporus]|jgi:DNA-binding PadR family transcriptional regulator|uniref:hypothetical protein n=1 Tax=Brevibacillus centrosporus TaxID=54910 RepID=UPI00398761D2
MLILANARGTRGQKTKPVAMSAPFLRALFNIEQRFADKSMTFSINEGGRKRQLNHVTEADLYVATVLFSLCNTNGSIHRVSRHAIYQRLEELYENPISSPQFYEALEKFKLHHLIFEEQHEYGVVSYKINYFHQEESENELPWMKSERPKAARYFMLHPVVFSAAFTSLSLSGKKLFYAVAAQQGENKHKAVERLFSNRNTDVQFMGLYQFLHKAHPYQIRKVLDELTSRTLFMQTPFFTKAEVHKASGQYKASLAINPDFILSAQKGVEYREVLKPRKVYKRTALFIERILSALSIREFVTDDEINELVRYFKGKGYRIIRPALEILKQYFNKHRNLPQNIVGYLVKSIRSVTEFTYRNILKRTGLLDFVAPIDADDHDQRWSQFLNAICSYQPRMVEKACAAAAPQLTGKYLRTVQYDYAEYRGDYTGKELKGIELVRKKAFVLQKHVDSYISLENGIHTRSGDLSDSQIIDWLLAEVEKLPNAERIVVVPSSFNLESYLQGHFPSVLAS